MNAYNMARKWYVLGLLSLTAAATGCGILPDRGLSGPANQVVFEGFDTHPRTRFGGYAAAIPGMTFLGSDLGPHSYYWPFREKDGIAYTCRGGHIDVVHMRNGIDWTAYLVAESYKHIMRKDPGFSCKMPVDRSRHYVQITYPPGWDYLSRQDRSDIAERMALAIGPYLTFTMVTWHEVTTWYGYKSMGIPVEYDSAFSWEDSFSNLLGTRIAVRALQDKKHSYNKAVALAIDEEMQRLGIVSTAREARETSKSMKGLWYTGTFVLAFDMKKRNFDIGLDDGYITPTLVPHVTQCPDAEPLSYPVPTLDILTEYGFSVKHEIEPHEWEKNKILRVALGDEPGKRIDPQVHMAIIMDHIQRQAAAKYGPEYDPDNRQREPQYVYTGK
ncbi:MAG: DUF4056 domain-containing protein [Solirubrobacterales bacterium]